MVKFQDLEEQVVNEGFDGGDTNFYTEAQAHYSPPEDGLVTYRYHPRQGSCLLFNHRITHDGQPLRGEGS